MAQRLQGLEADDSNVIKSKDELLQPLLLCYRSLIDSNLPEIANGQLLDFIYRVNCFGIELLKSIFAKNQAVIAKPFQQLPNT